MFRLVLAAMLAVCTTAPTATFAEADYNPVARKEQAQGERSKGVGLRALLTGKFQKNRKTPEVTYSAEWLDAQPKAQGDENWACLSEALYFEARGETVKGQFAVAEVIQNRVKSERFPDSLCGVIRQGTGRKYQCQFTYTCDGNDEVIAERQAFERVAKVARAIIDGGAGNLTDGATHYHTRAVRPSWARVYKETTRIGVHIFYRHNYRTASNE